MSVHQDMLRDDYEDRLESEITCIGCQEVYDKDHTNFTEGLCPSCIEEEDEN